MNNAIRIRIKNQTLRLLPQKAVYWEEQKALMISDLNPGKVSGLKREVGPEATNGIEKNYGRLNQLMRDHQVERIIFTGDLFNGKDNEEWKVFTEWRKDHTSVEMDIVVSNQDQSTRNHFSGASITVNESELTISPFTFCHQSKQEISFDKYFICGHIHPVFGVQGLANQNVRLPCFYFGKMQAILPSFGQLTGGFEVKKKNGDQVYLVLDNSVVEVK